MPTAESSDDKDLIDEDPPSETSPELRAVLALEKLADAQTRLAVVAEQNSAILERDVAPYASIFTEKLRDMIEQGFGARIVK